MRRDQTLLTKTRINASLLVCAFVVSTGLAQQPQPSGGLQDPSWIKEFAHKRIVYSVPGMARVKVAKNLVYKRVQGEELKMDVYSPPGTGRRVRRPVVVFIHGGRVPPNLLTTPKEWGAYVSFGQLVAASGFVGVTFNHRFYTWNSLPDSQSDVMDLIVHIRVQLALSKNLTIDLYNHATGQHGFDIEDNNDRSRQIIMRTIEFIKAHH